MGKSIVHDTQNFINMFKKDISIKRIKNYDRIVISGMGGSGVGCWDYILTVVGVTGT